MTIAAVTSWAPTCLAAGAFGALGWGDVAVIVAAIGVMIGIGLVSGRRETGTRDFFLGERRVPTAVATLSFVATEISAMTIVAVPAVAYSKNWQYLQFFIGSAAARLFVAFVFLPRFWRTDVTTIYEYLRERFGPATQYAGSIFFFITRLLMSGVRLYAACMAVAYLATGISVPADASAEAGHWVIDWSLIWTIIAFSVVSIAIIGFGGIRAVVWTGAYQAIVFYLLGAGLIVYLLAHIHGGVGEAYTVAHEGGRLAIMNWSFSLSDSNTVWGAFLNAFFVGLVVFGTDQEMVQRLLTVRTRGSSQRALVATIGAGLPMVVIYLAVGTLLYVFYQQNSQLPVPPNSDKILAHFGATVLPMGLKGLVLATIVLASIDSPLVSLSSSFVTDIYRPLLRRDGTERHYLWVSRVGVLVFGLVLGGLAYSCRSLTGILWVSFQILSVTGGATLGVFLLGALTRVRSNRGNVAAMVASALTMAGIMALGHFSEPMRTWANVAPRETVWQMLQVRVAGVGLWIGSINWTWLIVIGTALTFVLGLILSKLGRLRGNHSGATS